MATWHGEPYPGAFSRERMVDEVLHSYGWFSSSLVDPNLNEEVEVDHKWMTYEDVAFEGQSKFAELNQAVLEFIHFEKRFPNKEELTDIRNRTLPSELFSWNELNNIFKLSELEDVLKEANAYELNDLYYVSDPAISYQSKYEAKFTEPECPWNGITYEDFIKNDPPKTALASKTGLNKHTLNHRLL